MCSNVLWIPTSGSLLFSFFLMVFLLICSISVQWEGSGCVLCKINEVAKKRRIEGGGGSVPRGLRPLQQYHLELSARLSDCLSAKLAWRAAWLVLLRVIKVFGYISTVSVSLLLVIFIKSHKHQCLPALITAFYVCMDAWSPAHLSNIKAKFGRNGVYVHSHTLDVY